MYQMQQQQKEHKHKLALQKQEYEQRLKGLQTVIDQVGNESNTFDLPMVSVVIDYDLLCIAAS